MEYSDGLMKNIRYKYTTPSGVQMVKELPYNEAWSRVGWLNNENRPSLKTMADWEEMLCELEPLLIALYPQNKKVHKAYVKEVRAGVAGWLAKVS